MKTHLEQHHVIHRCLRALENLAVASNAVKVHMKDKGAVAGMRIPGAYRLLSPLAQTVL